MAGTFFKWLIPGIVAIGGGTALAIALGGVSISSDLQARALAALDTPETAWATVSIEGRDAILAGTATTQDMIDEASAKLAGVHGVRAVDSAVTLAEYASPFPFEAQVKDGVITLTGGFPNEASHKAMLGAAPGAKDDTRLLSGSPEAAKFNAASQFGLRALSHMDEGEIKLADLALTVVGRAKSPESFDDLSALESQVPSGVTLAAFKVTPAVAKPYRWEAEFDGTSATVSGFTPDPAFSDLLRVAAGAIPVSTALTPASGEPPDFTANALILLKSLLSLEQGTAAIEDRKIALSGSPRTAEIADEASAAVTGIGGTVALDPPRVVEYTFSATKAGDGIGFLGFVPDAQTRERLAAMDHADATKLKLARGAPERFDSAIDFGLAALDRMSEGEFTLSGTHLSLTGRAATLADFNALSATAAEGPPQGLTLAAVELTPPIANPFTFSATKDDSGRISFAGYVPSETDRTVIHQQLMNLGADNAALADGAPRGFTESVRNGLAVLVLLDTGTLLYDGRSWSIQGVVDSAQKGFAADAAYSIAGLRTAGWTYKVQLPPEPTLPIIAPYVWSAQKSAGGALRFTGFSPNQDFKDTLVARGGADSDATLLGAGAPDNFTDAAAAGLDALARLEEGSLALSGRNWTLTGRAGSASSRTEIQDALSAAIDPSLWRVAIQTPDALPIVTPYLWSADKHDDGAVDLAGYLPSEDMRKFVETRAGNVSRDTTALASGEPSGFSDDVLAGLDALSHLTTGTASFDGSKWTLEGRAATTAEGELALASLLKGSRAGVHWDRAIEGLVPPVPESSSEISPDNSSEPTETPPVPESVSAPTPSSSEPPSAPVPSSSSEPSAVLLAPTPEQSSSALAEVTPTMPADLAFEASRSRGGPVTLAGAVSTEEIKGYLSVIAGKAPVDAISVDGTMPSTFIPNAKAAIDAVVKLAEARAGFDGRRWWLSGKAADPAVRDSVLATIAALPTSIDWSTNITLVPAIDLCRDTVGALAARNAIVFNSGSATLTDESSEPLDELAGDLDICPDTTVHVEGHTDSDGAEDVNLALSVARAEAVVEALIARGVAVERLYAEGYGETMPIASNDTKQGKQANRRIAFTITEGD
ncbi:MAG TPA: OmpA family protein [Devosia sp.]|nr:OmpA family protein [Devosia sp.]